MFGWKMKKEQQRRFSLEFQATKLRQSYFVYLINTLNYVDIIVMWTNIKLQPQ